MGNIDDELKTNFGNDRQRFIANLVFTSNWFLYMVEEFLKPYGLSQQQYNILRILKGADDWVSMNDIKALMIDKFPNATRLSDKLLKKGLVARKRGEKDRRTVYLSITEKGRELVKTLDNDTENQKYLVVMDRMTDEEAREFSKFLDKIRG